MKAIFSVCCLGLMLLTIACKHPKALVKTPAKVAEAPVPNWTEVYQKSLAGDCVFERLSASGNVDVNIPSQGVEMGFAYKLHIQRDSMIWLRVTKFGLEGMRILITPSKIQILDRMNNNCRVMQMAQLKQLIGIDADFRALQRLLLGEVPMKLNGMDYGGDLQGQANLVGEYAGAKIDYRLEKIHFRMTQMTAVRDTVNANLQFLQHQQVESYWLPMTILATVSNGADKQNFALRHDSYKLNPSDLTFNFNIPDNYNLIKN